MIKSAAYVFMRKDRELFDVQRSVEIFLTTDPTSRSVVKLCSLPLEQIAAPASALFVARSGAIRAVIYRSNHKSQQKRAICDPFCST